MNGGRKKSLFCLFDPVMLLAFLILIAAIISNLTSYKVVKFMGIDASLGTLTMPLILMFLNPIAEVYGRLKAHQIMIATCVLEVLFSVLFTGLSYYGVACDAVSLGMGGHRCGEIDKAYKLISGNIVRGALSFCFGFVIGSYFNTVFLLYLKMLWSSRIYFVRDIFSSIIGEILYTAVCFVLAFSGVFPISVIANIFMFSIIFKLLATVIFSGVSQFILAILRKHKKYLDESEPSEKIKFSSRYLKI
jgi:uncharacterized integral membrane protein (TIGR00697 family)